MLAVISLLVAVVAIMSHLRAPRTRAQEGPEEGKLVEAPWWIGEGRITQLFGCTSLSIEPRVRFCPDNTPFFHSGVDVAMQCGRLLLAPYDLRVMSTGRCGEGLGANCPQLQSADGSEIRLGHVAATLASPGVLVRRGEALAIVGTAGRSTGCHVHFEIRRSAGSDPVDPRPWLLLRLAVQRPEAPAHLPE